MHPSKTKETCRSIQTHHCAENGHHSRTHTHCHTSRNPCSRNENQTETWSFAVSRESHVFQHSKNKWQTPHQPHETTSKPQLCKTPNPLTTGRSTGATAQPRRHLTHAVITEPPTHRRHGNNSAAGLTSGDRMNSFEDHQKRRNRKQQTFSSTDS